MTPAVAERQGPFPITGMHVSYQPGVAGYSEMLISLHRATMSDH